MSAFALLLTVFEHLKASLVLTHSYRVLSIDSGLGFLCSLKHLLTFLIMDVFVEYSPSFGCEFSVDFSDHLESLVGLERDDFS